MKKQVCEFEIKDLLPIGLTFVVLGIALAYGLNVMGDIKTDMAESACEARSDNLTSFNETSGVCWDGAGNISGAQQVGVGEYNASVSAIEGVAKIPEKLPLIATVVVAAIIIGILVRYLMVRYS